MQPNNLLKMIWKIVQLLPSFIVNGKYYWLNQSFFVGEF
jgi:hypothetical protein